VCCVLFLVCLYICVCECLLQINIAGVPSSRATFGFPQYCASTCVRFGCTQHDSNVDTKPKFCFVYLRILRISGISPFFRNSRSGWFLSCLVSRFGGQLFTLLNHLTSDLFLLPAHTTAHLPPNHTWPPHNRTIPPFHSRPHTRPSGGHGWCGTRADLKHTHTETSTHFGATGEGGKNDHTRSGATGGRGRQPCLMQNFHLSLPKYSSQSHAHITESIPCMRSSVTVHVPSVPLKLPTLALDQ